MQVESHAENLSGPIVFSGIFQCIVKEACYPQAHSVWVEQSHSTWLQWILKKPSDRITNRHLLILAPGIHFCPLCCVKFIQLYYFISSSHPPQKFYPPKNAMTCKRKFFTFDVCETGQSWRTQGANNSFILVGKQVFKLSHSKGRCENGLTSCISLQKGSSMLVSSYPPLDPKMAKLLFFCPVPRVF